MKIVVNFILHGEVTAFSWEKELLCWGKISS